MFSAKSLGSERLTLVTPIEKRIGVRRAGGSAFLDLLSISARRCSAFFAEAAVLVLVLALLDRLILKGSVDLTWIVSVLGLSVGLLAASILTEFGARRWL